MGIPGRLRMMNWSTSVKAAHGTTETGIVIIFTIISA